jgi:hypothetical protein
MSDDLRIVGVRVQPPSAVPEEAATRRVQPRLQLQVDVENAGDAPLHVWASRRAFDYDPASRRLTLHLAETEPETPPGIEIVSEHPRVPQQVVVAPGARTTIDVPVPTMVRRRVPGVGLGMSFVEEPIDQVGEVELHVQYADVPFQRIVEESPSEHRERLRAHGGVVRATLAPQA